MVERERKKEQRTKVKTTPTTNIDNSKLNEKHTTN